MRYNKYGERVVEAVLDTNVISDLVMLVTDEQAYRKELVNNPTRAASIMVLQEIIVEELDKNAHRGFLPIIALTTSNELVAGINKQGQAESGLKRDILSKLAMLNRRYDMDILNAKGDPQYGYVFDCLRYVSTFSDEENLQDLRIMATAAVKNLPVITEDAHFFGENGEVREEIADKLKIYQEKAKRKRIKVDVDQAKPYSTYEFIREFFPEKIDDIKKIMKEIPGRPGDGGMAD